MKLKDFNIKDQLKIGFGIIVLLILVLSGVAWKLNDTMTQQTKDIYYHSLVIRRALGSLRMDVLLIQRDTKEIALTQGKENISSIIGNIETYKSDAQRQFKIIYDQYLGPKNEVETVINDYEKWNAIRQESLQLLQESNTPENAGRIKKSGVTGQHSEVFFKDLDKIDQSSSQISDQLIKDAQDLNRRLKSELLLAVGVVLSLTLLIIQILSKNIRVPLTELTDLTRNFKKGKRSARSNYHSANEFGLLSEAFNQMTESIETELALSQQSAKMADVMLREDDAREFCRNLLTTLQEYTGAQMGAVFLSQDNGKRFELFEAIGLESSAPRSFSISDLEGELGTAFALKKIQLLSDLPENTLFTYLTFSGKIKPREIITIPLQLNSEPLAVISLASVKRFSDLSLRLLENISSILSARMDGVLTYRKLVDFSQKLESQNKELESQKNELSSQATELSQQNLELGMQKKQVDEANRLKTAFLSNMSHELRTPLNSVIALSGVLNRKLKGRVPDEEYSYLEVIERNGKQLLELINDILDLSRIESGREEVNISSFSLDKLIREVIEVLQPQARQKNISLTLVNHKELPQIKSDVEKYRHILQNILANAVKFTEKGGVSIQVDSSPESVVITVSDTGIGIEKQYLKHIFEEFRQVESSNSRKYGGTGLGLAIAKKYAELLGGHIEVESVKGKGSKFKVVLPVEFTSEKISERSEEEIYQSPKSERSLVSSKDKTILLVEDMEPIIIQLRDFLEAQDYRIEIARDGAEALDKIAAKVPDAMILDLMMPGIDGFEVLRRIRQDEKTINIPVIILTAKYITAEELDILRQDHIHQLIQKGNINKDQLLNIIERMMHPSVPDSAIKSQKPKSDKPLILIIEDNPDNMITIKALLPEKCEILEAEEGHLGVTLAKKHKPDLILLDNALPEMSGVEVLKEIRKDSSLKEIPVVAVTASAMKGDREELLANGFNQYISKPLDNELFQRIIQQYV